MSAPSRSTSSRRSGRGARRSITASSSKARSASARRSTRRRILRSDAGRERLSHSSPLRESPSPLGEREGPTKWEGEGESGLGELSPAEAPPYPFLSPRGEGRPSGVE